MTPISPIVETQNNEAYMTARRNVELLSRWVKFLSMYFLVNDK